MASCSLCRSFGSTKIQYNYDLATAHARTHILQLKMIDEEIEEEQIFKQCFPDFAPINTRMGSRNPSRRALIALCRTLFDRKSNTPHVICKKCDAEIQIFDRSRKHLKLDVLIEHASAHLRLNIYECRYCVRKFITKSAIMSHMATNHQLRTTVGHFRCKLDEFVLEISAMIKACFSGGGKKTRPNSGATIQSSSISTIRHRTNGSHLAIDRQVFCYRLVRKLADRNGNVQCRLCSKGIKAIDDGTSIHCQGVREHAFRHLPTPIYRCGVCSEAYFSCTSIKKHLLNVHALPCLEQNYVCLADQYHSEVLSILNKCYSNGSDSPSAKDAAFRTIGESKINRMRKTQSTLTVRRQLLCYRLLRKCASAEGLVECRLCSKQLIAKWKNMFATAKVMQHALVHLNTKLYECKKCSSRFSTRACVQNHLKREHALPSGQTNYQCLGDQFHDDIVRTLHRCYGEEGREEDVPEDGPTSVKRESSGSTTTISSKLTIQRQALCIQLTAEHSDQSDKRLQCRLCDTRISVKKSTGCSRYDYKKPMQHALVHLEKPIYRCKVCSLTFVTCAGIGPHMKTKHALPSTYNYECLADQFHADIMEILRKCYNNGVADESVPEPEQSRAERL